MAEYYEENLAEACKALEKHLEAVHARNFSLYRYIGILKNQLQHLLEYTVEQFKPLRQLESALADLRQQYQIKLAHIPRAKGIVDRYDEIISQFEESLTQLERALGILVLEENFADIAPEAAIAQHHHRAGLHFNLERQLHKNMHRHIPVNEGNAIASYEHLQKQQHKLEGANHRLEQQIFKHEFEILELSKIDSHRREMVRELHKHLQHDVAYELNQLMHENVMHGEHHLGHFFHAIHSHLAKLEKIKKERDLMLQALEQYERQQALSAHSAPQNTHQMAEPSVREEEWMPRIFRMTAPGYYGYHTHDE